MLATLALLALMQTGPARVIDGDTLDIARDRVRLYGIDAPEAGQSCGDAPRWPCGTEAAAALTNWIAGRPVTCVEIERDRYQRAVSTCTVDGEDLGDWMVRSGWAVEYRQYSDGRYAEAERAAAAAGAGIHRSTFTRPSDWRRDGDQTQVAASYREAGDCRIKGNISANGERIYHMPGMRSYGPTRIDEAAGERWFCSEADAIAAGWRAPRQ